MPTKVEKDAITGTQTTGHEWDGIRELDTPMPRWWLLTFYACIAFSVVYVILYPAIPLVNSYTKGLLGSDSRQELDVSLAAAAQEKAHYIEAFEGASLEDILADKDLTAFALAGGRTAFADNCVPCHGAGGAGSKGYPTLADDDWLWGGTLDDIHVTLRSGIRWAGNDDTRVSDMPAFGRDEILDGAAIDDVAEYVLTLSGSQADNVAAARGAAVFAENCSACHGETGEGVRELGAPRLNDQIWLFGSDKAEIVETITNSRGGQMPSWDGRLSDTTLKQLAIFVHSLGGGE